MFEIYFYPHTKQYIVYNNINDYMTDNYDTLRQCLTANFCRPEAYDIKDIIRFYQLEHVITVDNLSTLEHDYPELFI